MTEDYWDGGTWVTHIKILNDGSNSGAHVYEISPGAGAEMEILYGSITNNDAAGRIVDGVVEDASGGNILALVSEAAKSLGATTLMAIPQHPGGGAVADPSLFPRFILSGTMNLKVTVAAVAVSKDTQFALVARIRGALPGISLTSPTGATETINTNRAF